MSDRAVGLVLPDGVESPSVVRVEEDWRLVLNEPDDDTDSPQFHTVMSPTDDAEELFAQVLWNYRETPDFVSGGVQLQCYDGETLMRYRTMEYGRLSTEAETITWTQSLVVDGLSLTFEVSHGQSTTWGAFGREMRISSVTDLGTLNSYDPEVSAENSCVTYGSNRVDELVITQVRYYGVDDSLLYVDAAPRMVYMFGDDE
ncbi:MAG: hypothetical protein AABZ47_03215 [Planctomycetota bacterium]